MLQDVSLCIPIFFLLLSLVELFPTTHLLSMSMYASLCLWHLPTTAYNNSVHLYPFLSKDNIYGCL
jgi:hypothetical protein